MRVPGSVTPPPFMVSAIFSDLSAEIAERILIIAESAGIEFFFRSLCGRIAAFRRKLKKLQYGMTRSLTLFYYVGISLTGKAAVC